MKITSNKKQYIMVLIITAAAVLVYLFCHKFNIFQPIAFQGDKPVDNFVSTIAVKSGSGQTGILQACEYNLQNVIMLLLVKICGNEWAGINIYYILTFFMISCSMYLFLSKLEIPAAVCAGLAVLAAFVPFHVDRGEGQMMTSNYFLAPLFMCMFYDMVYCKKTEERRKGYMALVCMAPFIDVRISIMAVLLMAVFLVQRHSRDFTRYMAGYLIPLTVLSGFAGIAASTLKVSDIELAKGEGMRILDMILPMRYHIVGFLSDKRLDFDVLLSAHGESGLNSLGVLFSAGFVCMMFCLFFEWKKDRRIAWMGMISMIVILISGICGIGSVIEYFGVNVTYWSRMAVFITTCSVAVTGMLIGNVYKYVEDRYGKKFSAAGCAVVYAVFAVEFFELILRQNM